MQMSRGSLESRPEKGRKNSADGDLSGSLHGVGYVREGGAFTNRNGVPLDWGKILKGLSEGKGSWVHGRRN